MTISSNTRQAGPFTGTGSASTFAFSFKVFSEADLVVIKTTTATGTDSTLTITTDYTVDLNENQNTSPGGSITLVAGNLASGYKLTITSDIDNQQPIDLTNQGGFYPSVINDALDRVTIQVQQVDNAVERSVKFPISDGVSGDILLPNIDVRKGTVLAFNESTGLPEAGPDIASTNTVAGNTGAINTVAGQIDPTNNVGTVAGIAGDVSTVANIDGNVTTVANNDSNITTVAGQISPTNNIGTVAARDTDIGTVAAADTNIGLVAGQISPTNNIATVAGKATDISTVAGLSAEIARLGTADAVSDLNLIATSAIVTDMDALAGIAADIDALGDVVSDIQILADIEDGTDATDAIQTAASNATHIATVAGQISPTNNISTVAGKAADITTVAGKATEIGRLGTADAVADMNTLGTAAIVADMDTLADIASDIQTLADIEDGTTATNAISTCATNVAAIQAYGETYHISATAPTSPTAGDLWFDTANDLMKVYGSGGWQLAGSSINGTSARYDYVVGTASGSYTGSTTTFPATYDAGYVDVYLNGIKLKPTTDFTATSGTEVVLASAATASDEVAIVGYGTFELVNFSVGAANDVDLSSLSDGDGLVYSSSSTNFEPVAVATQADLTTLENTVNSQPNPVAMALIFGS
jgi:hypothetical protein